MNVYASFTVHVYTQRVSRNGIPTYNQLQNSDQKSDSMFLPKQVLSSGAIASSNGSQSMLGTIGQPVIGIESNSASKLQLGFWASVMQNISGIELEGNSRTRPTEFMLHNYPNPFSQSTMISYMLPQSSEVRIEIYDALGKFVRHLIAAQQASGKHFTLWDGNDSEGNRVPSGYYFCTISTTSDYGNEMRERSSRRETLVIYITR